MPLKGSPSHFQVSVKKSAPRDSTLPQEPTLDKNSNQDEPRRTTEVWAQFGPLFLFAPLLPKILKSKIFAFGFAATAHRRGIPDDHGGVLHPCRESHGRGRGSGEGLRDRQHRLQAGAERTQGLARNVHPECKRSASPARYLPSPDGASREYLQPIWINDVCFSFAASALMELCQTAVALFSKWIIPSDSLLVNFKFQGPSSRLDT